MIESLNDRAPYIATALAVFAASILIGWLLRTLLRSAIRRYDSSLAQMVGGLTSMFIVALGILLALWIARIH